jgi:hypothetical protein
MNGLRGEEAIANYALAALFSVRLLRWAAHTTRLAPRNDKSK